MLVYKPSRQPKKLRRQRELPTPIEKTYKSVSKYFNRFKKKYQRLLAIPLLVWKISKEELNIG